MCLWTAGCSALPPRPSARDLVAPVTEQAAAAAAASAASFHRRRSSPLRSVPVKQPSGVRQHSHPGHGRRGLLAKR
uniref:Uncharacterized protein n=1 Tax=Zea mays TaxID=4577 RepID=B8A128_MAIZE|nr:unknown [Zea mays]